MAGSLKTLNIYQNGSSIYTASTFTSTGIWTDGNKIYKTNSHTPQSGDTELVTLTTTISGLYHNADGEQVSVGLNTVLVITTLAATDIIVYCVNASIKTTLDLSTLPDISDGTHTVKVKAKASGYNDSEFSNEVSYTKSAQPVNFTLYMESGYTGDNIPTYIKLDSTPANANDYDYVTKGDGSHTYGGYYLYNKAGNQITSPVTLSARYVYVWGFQVYINGAETVLYNGNKTYDTALKITLSQNDDIKIQCQYFYD